MSFETKPSPHKASEIIDKIRCVNVSHDKRRPNNAVDPQRTSGSIGVQPILGG
jgi:hypothetical protein